MAPYWLLLFGTGIAGFFLCELKKSRRRDLILLLIVTAVMVAMAALRAPSVGVDYEPYANYFQTICNSDFSFLFSAANSYRDEIGYSLFNYAVSLFSQNTFVFMGIVSGVIIILRAIFIYRHAPSVWIGLFVYISFGFFGYALCTIRQELGISVYLFALPFLQKRKLLPYVLITALAATFHLSLWFMIPIYFLAHLPFDWRLLSIYGVGTLVVLAFSEQIVDFITKFIFTTYKPGTYYMMGRDYNTAFIPVVLFVISYLLRKLLLKRSPQNIVLLNFSCYAAIFFILTLKNFIFQRIALMFLPAAILLIPEMIRSLSVDESKYTELQTYKKLDGAKKKQKIAQYSELKEQYREELTLYYTSMGLILAGCMLYFLFLLSANRLLIVPYVLFF